MTFAVGNGQLYLEARYHWMMSSRGPHQSTRDALIRDTIALMIPPIFLPDRD